MFESPRPKPLFFREEKTFSTKKARGAPRDSVPPCPPVKSAPPIHRFFSRRPVTRAQIVSFRNSPDDSSILSPGYNENSQESYFNQCFTVISQLGAGSFGQVYKVRSKEDGKLYAVKKSRERFRGESDRRRKLEEVARQEKLLPHPNCVRIYKAWEERERLYLLVELCKTSLSDYSEKNHDIPEALIWKYLVDLLMAVKHLHDNNLVHMDIKPDNIFISNEGICKLGDFGLVIDLSQSHSITDAQEGDPKYLAPELMNGRYGKPADIFSLGMSILELSGDLDLPRCGSAWHLLRNGTMPEENLKAKSFNLKYVIRQMVDPDPWTRPTVEQVLAFPSVRKVWKQRRRDYLVHSVVETVKSSWLQFWRFLLYLVCVFMTPFQRLTRKQSPSTPSNSSDSGRPVFDHSLSDDEVFESNNSNCLHNNSVGAMIVDTSSDGSFQEDSSARKPPPRKVFTTPAVRHRRFTDFPSPMSSSPRSQELVLKHPPRVLAMSLSDHSPIHHSPVEGGNPDDSCNMEEERPVTPIMSLMREMDEDTPTKAAIEPKNLLGMFDAATDDEM